MTLRSIILASIILAGVAAAASARGPRPLQECSGSGIVPGPDTVVLCTKLIDFNGVCGRSNFPGVEGYEDVAAFLNPWESDSITIREVQVTAVLQGPIINGQPQPSDLNIGIFSGNSYNADPMTPYEYTDSPNKAVTIVRAHDRFPTGTGMQFPGKAPHIHGPDPHLIHLDVHVDCGPEGASYVGRWFLAYTVNKSR